ncbi:toll-like receptor 7 [Osmerus mordax]|uniref:toll-like receptor 7 n=1 Tax=Osmerus mordax TaxID=8014 RepID=UPI0035105D54
MLKPVIVLSEYSDLYNLTPGKTSDLCQEKPECVFLQVCVGLLGLLVSSTSAGGRWYPKSLPCDVSLISNGSVVSVDCTERQLTFIPKGIPSNTTNLTLTINHIPALNSTSFYGLENLTEIDMRCNCVPVKVGPKDRVCLQSVTIENDTFTKLRSLRSLYLDGNQLNSIPKGLPQNLILLSLEVNHIYSILRDNLSDITNVEILYLGQNCYYRNPCNVSYEIEDGAFSRLSNMTLLSLKSNNLSYIPAKLPTSLRELYIYNNNIEKVTKEDFQNLTNLEILDISGNCPRCYNAPFPCVPCPHNSQLQIDDDAFKTLSKLRILRMHSNSLTNVRLIWFQNCSKLQVIDLSSNFLAQDITTTKFPQALPNLEELDLSFNYALQMYPLTLQLSRSFRFLKSLKVFRIRGFVFQELTLEGISPLVLLPNLSVIDLGFNFIKIANLSSLMELKHFKIINLSENKISLPSEGPTGFSFSGQAMYGTPMSGAEYHREEVKEVHYFRYDEYARSCKYKDKEEVGIVNSFVNSNCSQFGKTLDISRNNIFFLHSRFLNLSDIRCLNLSGNAMSQSLNGSEFTLLSNIQYLDFSENRLDLLYSTAFKELTNLVILDISKNNHYFEAEGLTHMLNFTSNLPKLKTLLMNHNQISTSTNTEMMSWSLETLQFINNRLDMLWRDGDTRYFNYFKNLRNLKALYISNNNLNFIPQQVFGGLPDKLIELYINNNKLTSFAWKELNILQNLEVLDLSGNRLTKVPVILSNCTQSLKKLLLCDNRIAKLSKNFLMDAFSLKILDLSVNRLQHIEPSSFPDNVVNHMDMLLLHNNRFLCTCNATWFVTWLNSTEVNIPKLATEVTCSSPGTQRGHPVISVDLQACQHNYLSIILYILFTSLVLGFLVLSISSHLFLWDVWYIYHFCMAKLKGYSRLSTQNVYDAFAVYDTSDPAVSEWVLQELRVHLEECDDHRLRLCLEERDWIPGCPLIDNLSQSIHQSKRTMFILTNRYIRSGNFKTAFYMAHQRLMDEKDDVIVLIFLEKSPSHSKYLRLRKRLYRRSVLEWPTNPQAQPYFWFALRSVLATESHKQYSNLFKETL